MRFQKPNLPAVAAAAVLAGAMLLAACGGGNTSQPKAQPSSGSGGMSMGGSLRGKPLDQAFLNGMVPHHQAAIDMSRAELEHGKDPQVRQLAQSIIADQSQEIAQMELISKQGFGNSPRHDMSGPSGQLMGEPISMDVGAMAGIVSSSPDPDRAFLQGMIPHHAMAISMANEEAMNGADQRLKAMAGAIIMAQAQEIGEMQRLLKAIS